MLLGCSKAMALVTAQGLQRQTSLEEQHGRQRLNKPNCREALSVG